MELAVIGVGLWIFALPMLYVMGVMALWAKLRSSRARIVAVLAAIAIAVVIGHKSGVLEGFLPDEEWQTALAEFSRLCSESVTGERLATLEGAKAVTFVGGSPVSAGYDPNSHGNWVFPNYLVPGLALSGVRRFEVFSGYGFYNSVDEKGMLSRRKPSGTSEFDVGLTWELSDQPTSELITSLALRITDLKTGETLGIQPAYVWLGSTEISILFPSLARIQNRGPRFHTCPEPIEIMRFIKRVAQPPLEGVPND